MWSHIALKRCLHPDVEVLQLGSDVAELHDHRTGLRIAIDALPALDLADEVPAELLTFLAEIGCGNDELAESEVRRRQHVFRESQAWPERVERFRALLTFAVRHVPFYRDGGVRYDWGDVVDRESVAGFPILRKRVLRENFMRLCADNIDYGAEIATGRIELVATSGTTEDRVQAWADSSLVRVPADYPEIWDQLRTSQTPRTAVMTSPACMGSACTSSPNDLSSRIVHEHTLFLPAIRDPFAISQAEIERIADELFRFAPTFLLVNPVHAHAFGRRARQLGVPLPPLGCVLSSYQYLSRLQRRGITAAFGAPVFNIYSATELGGCQIGLECKEGRLHAREDHCLVELVGRTGQPVDGELGAIVVTTLAGSVMPLVRYEVGDLATRSEEVCTCPLADWPSFVLHGRAADALRIGDNWFTTRSIDELVSQCLGFDFYCLRQSTDRNVKLEVVPSLDTPFDATELRERLAALFGTSSVQVEVVRGLEPAPSFKYPLTRPLKPWLDWFT